MTEFTHFDDQGNAHMVDVSGKEETVRTAVAQGSIRVSREVLDAIAGKKVKKGDVLTVAQVAGIQAVKENARLIPMCHPIPLLHTALTFETEEENRVITAFCEVKTQGKTGAEMEALTGVSVALLTIYDMCKAIDKRMVIGEIRLSEKHGGASGDFVF
ncbi:MAG: cyclic pyranopterin monophosphate synthase MoaC [Lachnospiraceae bacterium]|nr:cyclic pyranopterin monophosphate synthase MoaC [Lachnospiraceae bacterium]